MGGVDKGLQPFRGKRLVDHVYERLLPQVGGVIINANQNQEAYRTFGVRVVSDAVGGFAGPLAGMHAGLSVSKRPFLASVPCEIGRASCRERVTVSVGGAVCRV